MAFRILCRPECNILKGFSGDQFRQVREGVIRCILATDMARHNEILDQFKQITPVFDFANLTHANLVSLLISCRWCREMSARYRFLISAHNGAHQGG
jgi:high affinity cGMP-specific 3',5'-cyclic phosphodiesterase 9